MKEECINLPAADALPDTGSVVPGQSADSRDRHRARRSGRAPGDRHRESSGARLQDNRPTVTECSSGLCIGQLNIQSLKPKLLELTEVLHKNQVDLLGLCETWLRPTTPSRLLVLPGYHLYRADRPDNSGYGGVALVARDGLSVSRLDVSVEAVPNSKLETLWTLVKPETKRQLIVCIVYRPPRRNSADLEADFLDLENQYQLLLIEHPSTKFVICGDLNCDWLKPNSDRAKRILLNFLTDYTLIQCVTDPTYSTGSLLDVLVSSCSQMVQRCVTSFCHFSPHKIVFAHLIIPRLKKKRFLS